MKLIRITLIFIVAFTPVPQIGAQSKSATKFALNPYWLQQKISWQKAPPEIDPKLSAGSASAFCFGPDGTLKYWSGTVYKKDGLITVSAGDAETIGTGHWVFEGDTVHASFRKIYADVRLVGEKFPGDEKALDLHFSANGEQLLVIRATEKGFIGVVYEINPKLSTASFDAQTHFNPGTTSSVH
jgi:hypothetical protein